MYLSDREKQTIRVFFNQSLGISVEQLGQELTISERTVYRVLKSLTDTLVQFDIDIEKDNGLYYLRGPSEQLESLKAQVREESEDLSPKNRQSLILLTLLTANEYVKKEGLAANFKVSKGTVDQDLKVLGDVYSHFDLKLIGRKGQGVSLDISELNRRLLISYLISQSINDFEFFSYLTTQDSNENENAFFNYLSSEDIKKLYQYMQSILKEGLDTQNDTRLKQFLIYLDITFNRIASGFNLQKADHALMIKEKEQGEFSAIVSQYQEIKGRIVISQEELVPLLNQWHGVFQKSRNNNKIDAIETAYGYSVNRLILNVSYQMQENYYLEDELYHDLFVHIASAISRAEASRIVNETEDTSLVMAEIRTRYPVLYDVVEKEVTSIFHDTHFSEGEILYIVLHFASMASRMTEVSDAKLLLVCSAGMGTSKMLENTIRKYFPEIQDIATTSIVNLFNIPVLDYDLILSTSYLKGFEHPYKIVSSILQENDLLVIKDELNKLSKKGIQQTNHQLNQRSESENQDFGVFVDMVNQANQIVSQFDSQIINNEGMTLAETIQQLSSEVAIDDQGAEQLKNMLMDRMALSPIGFPDTEMAFFHGLSSAIKQPVFYVYDLSSSYDILDFNKETIKLKRILLMLGRENQAVDQEMLGWISASIVDSTENMAIYHSGTSNQIKKLIQQTMLEKIKKG